MKWLYVMKGRVHKQIIFVACNEHGKPFKCFKDMNYAYAFEKDNDFENSIADFNNQTKLMYEARWRGAQVIDERPITPMTEFTKLQKLHKTELKI